MTISGAWLVGEERVHDPSQQRFGPQYAVWIMILTIPSGFLIVAVTRRPLALGDSAFASSVDLRAPLLDERTAG